MARFLTPTKSKIALDRNASKARKTEVKNKLPSSSWEMSARDALRVNFLTSEV